MSTTTPPPPPFLLASLILNPNNLSGFKRSYKPINFAPNPVLLPLKYNSFATLSLNPTRNSSNSSNIIANDIKKAKRQAIRY